MAHPAQPRKKRPNRPAPAGARTIAAEILQQLFSHPQPVKPLFERLTNPLSHSFRRDVALCKELVYGVLRNRRQLDRALTLLSSTPLRKLDPSLHQVLAVGLYQLLFLTRIPDSAAVNEAVNSCRNRKPPIPKRLHGFVNGVLRSAIRQREELQQQMTTDAAGKPILNHPRWLTERWEQRLGAEACRQLCAVNNRPPLLSLRLAPQLDRTEYASRLEQEGLSPRLGSFAPQALLLERGNITELPRYTEGLLQVQDQAAQLATLLLAPFSAVPCLDACAGLGGKTGHLLQLFTESPVHAVEPEPFRAEKIPAAAGRALDRLHIHPADLLSLDPATLPSFGRILVDAPCSGLGVIRRQPDIRWNRRAADLSRFQQRQLALLFRAALFAAEDTVLVYATCSTEPEENDQVVEAFLAAHPDFRLEEAAPCLPETARRFVRGNFFAPLPEEEIDGFFAARLVRGSPA